MLGAVLTVGGAGLLVYVLAGYPLLLAWRVHRAARPVKPVASAEPVHVSVLISAYNEQRSIERKIRSLWRLDWPVDALEVLVADDGSADDTRAILERLAAEPEAAGRLKLLPATGNLGKPSQLNRLAEAAAGPLLVFTDARQPLDEGAVKALARALSDPEVGGASGSVTYRTEDGQPVLIGAYWRYEEKLRHWEGLRHSVTGSAGPLNAVWKDCFKPFPANLVLDDMWMALRVALDGKRFVFVPDAQAIETFAMTRRHEYDRRVRTQAGMYQLIRFEPRLLWPVGNPIWWEFMSHRVGRLLLPWCMLGMLVGALLGGESRLADVSLIVQLAFYGYASIGWMGAGKPWAPPGSSVAYNLVLLGTTALAGLWRDLTGRTSARWGSAERHRR